MFQFKDVSFELDVQYFSPSNENKMVDMHFAVYASDNDTEYLTKQIEDTLHTSSPMFKYAFAVHCCVLGDNENSLAVLNPFP